MKRSGYVLFVLGQIGVILLTRFFFQWVVRFAEGTASGAPRTDGSTALFSAALVGAVFLGFRIFDALVDPFMGALGDAWVRSGRERRSLLWFALVWAPIGLVLVFTPDLSMAEPARWAFLIVGMVLFFAGYSFYSIPFWSLLDDYSNGDALVRTRLSNALGTGLLLATGIGFVVSPGLVGKFGFRVGAGVFAVVGALLMTLPYFAAPKSAQREAPRPEAAGEGLSIRPLRGVAIVLGDRRFLATLVVFAGAQMSFTIMTAAAPFIAERLLGGSLRDVALLLGPFLLASLASLSFVPGARRRHGTEKVLLTGALLLGVAYAGAGLLGGAWLGTPLVTAMVVFALAGPGASVLLGLQGEAIAERAAESEAGVTGSYFGVFNLVIQALNGAAVALTGFLAELGRTSTGPIRAMPILAGSLCVLGVLGYWFARPRAS